MPVTDLQGSSVPFASLGRSILSLRRDQVHTIDTPHEVSSASSGHGLEIEVFQKRVADLLLDLSADELLSLDWVRRLLDTFLICQEEFRAILFTSDKSHTLGKPPLDRIIAEFFDRSVKALDVLNAIRDGIDQLRHWRQQLEIIASALRLSDSSFSEGQVRRARKALTDLTLLMLDEKEAGGSFFAHRNRSFGRSGKDGPHHRRLGSGGSSGSASVAAAHFRSLSWSVSRSWSAARQLQVIGNNLAAPRANEVAATNGLAVPVFTMNSMLLFVMWALVAAIPCQDRGLQIHFSVPRVFPWAAPLMSLHEKILEESKRKERKNTSGLLREIMQIEKCTRQLLDLLDQVEFPVAEEKESEVRSVVEELVEVCGVLKEELDPLERQVREVFRRIVRSRSEGLESLTKSD